MVAQDLDSYQWKNRILILKDINLESHSLQAQLTTFKSLQHELDERDLLLFLVTDAAIYNEKQEVIDVHFDGNIKDYGLTNFNGLLLIGKDGGIKLKDKFFVKPSLVFDLIDGMPMRRSEMKNKK